MEEEELRKIFDVITNNALGGKCLEDGMEDVDDIELLTSIWEESIAKGLVKRGIWEGYIKHWDDTGGV